MNPVAVGGRHAMLVGFENRIRAVLYEFHDLAIAVPPSQHRLLDSVVLLEQAGELAICISQCGIAAFYE